MFILQMQSLSPKANYSPFNYSLNIVEARFGLAEMASDSMMQSKTWGFGKGKKTTFSSYFGQVDISAYEHISPEYAQ